MTTKNLLSLGIAICAIGLFTGCAVDAPGGVYASASYPDYASFYDYYGYDGGPFLDYPGYWGTDFVVGGGRHFSHGYGYHHFTGNGFRGGSLRAGGFHGGARGGGFNGVGHHGR